MSKFGMNRQGLHDASAISLSPLLMSENPSAESYQLVGGSKDLGTQAAKSWETAGQLEFFSWSIESIPMFCRDRSAILVKITSNFHQFMRFMSNSRLWLVKNPVLSHFHPHFGQIPPFAGEIPLSSHGGNPNEIVGAPNFGVAKLVCSHRDFTTKAHGDETFLHRFVRRKAKKNKRIGAQTCK